VAELDDPRTLMHREGSIFRAMCQVRVMLFHVCSGEANPYSDSELSFQIVLD